MKTTTYGKQGHCYRYRCLRFSLFFFQFLLMFSSKIPGLFLSSDSRKSMAFLFNKKLRLVQRDIGTPQVTKRLSHSHYCGAIRNRIDCNRILTNKFYDGLRLFRTTPTVSAYKKIDNRIKNNHKILHAGIADEDISRDKNNSAVCIESVCTKEFSIHAAVSQWVVFSDLHFSMKNSKLCIEVLRKVHQEAQMRRAGVIFLGDFWHLRGKLDVEPLNIVLRELEAWTQPVIMIPGNHDQVSFDGAIHALSPLEFAFKHTFPTKQALIISKPSLFLRALWVPFRRDKAYLKATLLSAIDPNVIAVFCHTEFAGASMNDNYISESGISPTALPSKKSVFCGHFHKPHVVPNTQIRYVGSPYQVSRSEAGQQKALLVLDSKTWKVVETINLAIGKRFFRFDTISSIQDSLNDMKPGDGVIINVGNRDGIDMEKASKLKEFFLSDAVKASEVEFSSQKATRKRDQVGNWDTYAPGSREEHSKDDDDTFFNWEGMMPRHISPADLLCRYLLDGNETTVSDIGNETNGCNEDIKGNTGGKEIAFKVSPNILLKEALDLLREVESNSFKSNSSGASVNSDKSFVRNRADRSRIDLQRVRLRSYGPFYDEVSYPLTDRGLVLIRGVNLDDNGSESNGSGKTSLAMAVLWGLCGISDPRLASDGKVTDVVHDATYNSGISSSRNGLRGKGSDNINNGMGSARGKNCIAEVEIDGCINGESFKIVRRRGKRASTLTFVMGSRDLTRQVPSETQEAVNEAMGIKPEMLSRLFFYGQHGISNGLLELSDTKLKERLADVLDLEIWQVMAKEARGKLKVMSDELLSLRANRKMRENDLGNVGEEITRLKLELEENRKAFHVSKHREVARVSGAYQDFLASLALPKERGSRLHGFYSLPKNFDDNNNNSNSNNNNNNNNTNNDVVVDVPCKEMVREGINQWEKYANEVFDNFQSAKNDLQYKENFQNKVKRAAKQLVELNSRREGRLNPIISEEDTLSTLANKTKMIIDHTRGLVDEKKKFLAEMKRNLNFLEIGIHKLVAEKDISSASIRHFLAHEDEIHNSVSEHLKNDCPTCGSSIDMGKLQIIMEKMNDTVRITRAKLEEQMTIQKVFTDRIETLEGEIESKRNLLGSFCNSQEILDNLLREAASIGISNSSGGNKPALQNSNGLVYELALQEWEEVQRKKSSVGEAQIALLTLENEIESSLSKMSSDIESAESRLGDRIRVEKRVSKELKELDSAEASLTLRHTLYSELIDMLSSRGGGIQNFALNGALSLMNSILKRYLDAFSNGNLRVSLATTNLSSSTSMSKSNGGENSTPEEGNKISRRLFIQGSDGTFNERSFSQLSGGQWKKTSLAFSFAYAEFVRQYLRVDFNVLVLDEIFTHLDSTSRFEIIKVLKSMLSSSGKRKQEEQILDGDNDETIGKRDANLVRRNPSLLTPVSTILLVLQDSTALELNNYFDAIDIVTRQNDASSVASETRNYSEK